MIEQDSAAGEKTIRLPVVDGHPVREEFADPVGAPRIERCVLVLHNGLNLAEHLSR